MYNRDYINNRISVFGCGVQKAGTTSLFSYLSAHPQMQAPVRKELHFFNNENINWNNPPYGYIDGEFPAPRNGRIRFEITPGYIFWANTLERIKVYNPNAKIILLFRDPFERAWSHWRMQYSKVIEYLGFQNAIRSGRIRVPESSYGRATFSYVERGFYGHQIERLFSIFPKDQVLCFTSNEFDQNLDATLTRISTFLEIDNFTNITPLRENQSESIDYNYEPTAEDVNYIADLVKDDLIKFQELTNLDLSQWPCWQAIK